MREPIVVWGVGRRIQSRVDIEAMSIYIYMDVCLGVCLYHSVYSLSTRHGTPIKDINENSRACFDTCLWLVANWKTRICRERRTASVLSIYTYEDIILYRIYRYIHIYMYKGVCFSLFRLLLLLLQTVLAFYTLNYNSKHINNNSLSTSSTRFGYG